MSVFDDLITKLSEKNLSDTEVDEILKAGEAYASVIGENEEILEGLSRLKLSVLDKKRNKDIKKRAKNIKNIKRSLFEFSQRIYFKQKFFQSLNRSIIIHFNNPFQKCLLNGDF